MKKTRKCILSVIVVYATLVTLDGNGDGSEQPQLVTVPADSLNGQEISLEALAGLAGHNNLALDLQVSMFDYLFLYRYWRLFQTFKICKTK